MEKQKGRVQPKMGWGGQGNRQPQGIRGKDSLTAKRRLREQRTGGDREDWGKAVKKKMSLAGRKKIWEIYRTQPGENVKGVRGLRDQRGTDG